jgi:hypothetical protein
LNSSKCCVNKEGIEGSSAPNARKLQGASE